MEVQFFYNQSDYRVINKTLHAGATFEGNLRDNCNIMNPIIQFDNDGVLRYNYAYIPQFRRYYTVSSISSAYTGLWDVSLEVDVLMSFRGDINNLYAIVDKQSESANGDEYIDDSSLVTDNIMFTHVYTFPNGFNEQPEYILITAG